MKRKLNKRAVALLVSLVVGLTAAVGVTLAYIFTNTDALENIFTTAQVSCAVVEKLDGVQQNGVTASRPSGFDIKSDVKIQNTGNTDAYIRVAVVVTWKSLTDNSTVLAQKPVEGTDYTVSWNLSSTGWVLGADGYYYYTSDVVPNGCTVNLINSCTPVPANVPDGYFLSVEIVASAIQSAPDSVVGNWSNEKVTVTGDDGTLTVTKKED